MCEMAKKTHNIEEQLRQAIADGGMSRYRLAQLTGVAEAVLSNFMNRKRSITLTTAAKLAEALGLELGATDKDKKGR
jgi:plasmid maintenance system antidote protein VapI